MRVLGEPEATEYGEALVSLAARKAVYDFADAVGADDSIEAEWLSLPELNALFAFIGGLEDRGEPEAALKEARKALRCLYIAVEKHVAHDVGEKVEAAFTALGAPEPIERREGALRKLQGELSRHHEHLLQWAERKHWTKERLLQCFGAGAHDVGNILRRLAALIPKEKNDD